jgi:hypothetical protein
MTGPFRIEPAMAPSAYKTYGLRQPSATHFRAATCEEAECLNFLNGWETAVDEATELGQRQAHYIRHDRTRRALEAHRGPLTVFTFEPGQRCFGADQHRVLVGREPLFFVREGDFRGNPSGQVRKHARAQDWVDDFATHQDRLNAEIEKG